MWTVSKERRIWKKKATVLFLSAISCFIFLYQANLLNQSTKVKWDVSSFLVYFHIAWHSLSKWIIYTAFPKTGRYLHSSTDFLWCDISHLDNRGFIWWCAMYSNSSNFFLSAWKSSSYHTHSLFIICKISVLIRLYSNRT